MSSFYFIINLMFIQLAMGKGKICVVLFCVVTVALFGTFLKLLIDIAPPPLKVDPDNETTVVDPNMEDAMYMDLEDFPSNSKLKYRLAQIIDKNNPKKINYTYIVLSPRRDSKVNIVLPPVWPSEIAIKESLEMESRKLSGRPIEDGNGKNADMNTLKGLVVKIINGSDPRIEIKIMPNKSRVENVSNNKTKRSNLKGDRSVTEDLKLRIDDDKIIIFNMTNNLMQCLNKIIHSKVQNDFSKYDGTNFTESQPNETIVVLTSKEWKLVHGTDDQI